MKLSIIIPLFNEIDYVDDLVKSLNTEDGIEKEILLSDGGSTDGTVQRLKELEKLYTNVKYVNNPDKYVSQAFNHAYKIATGEYIGLLGAHAEYSTNYFQEAITHLDNKECDAIGGFLQQKGKTPMGKAIAKCMSSKFGVGNTSVRTEKKKKYVQSVAFGFYRRKIFEEIGLFDEDLIKNQDDEFHYRLNAAGFKMLLNPAMTATYYVRSTLSGLYQQYYLYGYYKPLVFQKVPTGLRIRHIAPAGFILYLFTLPLVVLLPIWIIPLVLYILLILIFSIKTGSTIKENINCFLVYSCLHISYGYGFLRGILKWRF